MPENCLGARSAAPDCDLSRTLRSLFSERHGYETAVEGKRMASCAPVERGWMAPTDNLEILESKESESDPATKPAGGTPQFLPLHHYQEDGTL